MTAAQAPLDMDGLIARLKAEAARSSSAASASAAPASVSIPRLAGESLGRERYQLAELLCYSDHGTFLDNAYRLLLGRAPDEAGTRPYREYLRTGGSRLLVLYHLMCSPEGRARHARVDGMRGVWLYRVMPWKRALVPWMRLAERSYLRRNPRVVARAEVNCLRRELDHANAALARWTEEITAALQGVNRSLQQDLERVRREAESIELRLGEHALALEAQTAQVRDHALALEAQTAQVRDRTLAVEGHTAELRGGAEWLQRQIDEINGQLVTLRESGTHVARAIDAEVGRSQRLSKDVDFIRSDLIYHRTKVRELLDRLTSLAAESPFAAAVAAADRPALVRPVGNANRFLPAYVEDHLDAYYIAFEEEFRGSSEEIRATQEGYLADVRAAGAGGDDDPVLDLGCGRGEWLDLLAEQGLKGLGVDTSAAMVARCRERGLDVAQQDALRLLSEQPDAALGAVTAFHLIEHLPFPILYDLVEQAHRVLRPGGLLIFETPNPENVLVGSHTFYHDPTHRNPMTPTATRFLVRYFGFEDPEIRRLHPYPEAARVPGDDPLTERVNGHLCGPQDFAVIARKPIPPR